MAYGWLFGIFQAQALIISQNQQTGGYFFLGVYVVKIECQSF